MSQAEEPNKIQLKPSDSTILGVSLYGSRAEITRSYKFKTKKGQNNVQIAWLPMVMDTESLRVEGRGAATIQDVNLTENQEEPRTSSPKLDELRLNRTRTQKALGRCEKSINSLETYLGSTSVQHTKSNNLGAMMSDYETAASQLDDKLLELEQQLKQLDDKIRDEEETLARQSSTDPGRRASIGLVAEADSDVELILIYGVYGASWRAGYDIRVDTSGKDKPVTVVYKAIVSQSTQESWDNVPLTLETASPTFGVHLPVLSQWSIYPYRPPPPQRRTKFASASPPSAALPPAGFGGASEVMVAAAAPMMAMDHAVSRVTSQGSVSATFRVPGLVNIPADEGERSFTIVELQLGALMTWLSIPKVDTRVHLKAKIHNESEYTFLSGNASVYVDGSFISKIDVPPVSPNEYFNCPLGIDSSVRINYHPVSKKTSTSGIYNKSTNYVYTQRLTIHNTKLNKLPLIKVVDGIPVSEDAQITVKLLNPALKAPSGAPSGGDKDAGPSSSTSAKRLSSILSSSTLKAHESGASATPSITEVVNSTVGPSVKVSNGVVAVWDGADDPDVDMDALGKDGKIGWLCEVQAQEKLNLTLQWEVSSKVRVDGL
ncbi:hypothetical protein AAF712_005629 [Marasmius tenuissimus]|uniref:Mucoidy inhibitor A n=1 Tax=Marasmius tenuissimus TaxID=585030 RepID=A0ABR3A1L5_9AGAR